MTAQLPGRQASKVRRAWRALFEHPQTK